MKLRKLILGFGFAIQSVFPAAQADLVRNEALERRVLVEAARIAELSVAAQMQEKNIEALQEQIELIPGDYVPVASLGLYGVATLAGGVGVYGAYNFGKFFFGKGDKLQFIVGAVGVLVGGAVSGVSYSFGKEYEDNVNHQNQVLKSELTEALDHQRAQLQMNRAALEETLEKISLAVPGFKQKLAQVLQDEAYKSQVINKMLKDLAEARQNLSEQRAEMLTASSMTGLFAVVFLRSAGSLTIQNRGETEQAKRLLTSRWALGTVALLGAWTGVEVFQWHKATQEIDNIEIDLKTIEAEFVEAVKNKIENF